MFAYISYGVWLVAGLCCSGTRKPSTAVSLDCGLLAQASSKGAGSLPKVALLHHDLQFSDLCCMQLTEWKICFRTLGFISSYLIPVRTKPRSSVILIQVTWFGYSVRIALLILEGLIGSKNSLKHQ